MMTSDRIQNLFRRLSEFLGEFHPDRRVPTLNVVVHGLSDVVKKSCSTSDVSIQTKLVRNHLSDVGHFNGMPKDILAVTGSEVKLAHGLDDLAMEPSDVRFDDRILAGFSNPFFDVTFGL